MSFRDLVKMFTTGREPFVDNAPVPTTAELAMEPVRRDRGVIERFLRDGAWTREVDRA